MVHFLGEYEVTLDNKGRLLLPAGLKKQLVGEEKKSFVINRGFEKCLTLYPLETWKPIFERISQLNDFDHKVRAFRRYFLNGATQLTLDSAGRLLIPKHLCSYACLEKEIILTAATNKIEVWSKTKYEEFFTHFSPVTFSDLAQQVMVDNK